MNEKIAKAPLSFKPYLKSVIWGGNKICEYKGIAQTEANIGESWEISAVEGHVSQVESGEYAGQTLTQLIDRFGAQLLGQRIFDKYDGKFPLLVKLIDANDNLSVQVHPDDNLAMARHNSLGKTEMWYIIAAESDARIYAGLSKKISPEEYEQKVADGSFTEVLATHSSKPGDVFFLPAGRVHAIGAGNLLAEIQESSDITYRIFDYNRKDANGNTRELHTSQAKDAIDYTVYDNYKSEAPADTTANAEILSCSHFTVNRLLVDGEITVESDPGAFTVVMCIKGNATVECADGAATLSQGQTILIPAAADRMTVRGNATLLTAQP